MADTALKKRKKCTESTIRRSNMVWRPGDFSLWYFPMRVTKRFEGTNHVKNAQSLIGKVIFERLIVVGEGQFSSPRCSCMYFKMLFYSSLNEEKSNLQNGHISVFKNLLFCSIFICVTCVTMNVNSPYCFCLKMSNYVAISSWLYYLMCAVCVAQRRS